MHHSYSEEDIQDYACGNYKGDKEKFEAYLSEDPSAWVEVQKYRELYNIIQMETLPALSFNLADKVINKIHQREHVQSRQSFPVLTYVFILVVACALLITTIFFYSNLNFSFFAEEGITILSALVMLAFLIGFYYIERKSQQERLSGF
jgi:hypothetical protein